jgi:hypothetical protein
LTGTGASELSIFFRPYFNGYPSEGKGQQSNGKKKKFHFNNFNKGTKKVPDIPMVIAS